MDKGRWDDISSDYDDSVENNTEPTIKEYLKNEMQVLFNICKNMARKNEKLSIIDVGSGTGRVLFELDKMLDDDSISFYGIDNSEHMINRANKKKLQKKNNIKFIQQDSTEPELSDYFKDTNANVIMCLYNTLGVINPNKRRSFFENLAKIAGKKGLIIVSVFNGDNFEFAAPALYIPMKQMVKQIDEDSFDSKNKLFQNRIGYKSQWFTKKEIRKFLETKIEPFPIKVTIKNTEHILGHVFVDREVL